MMDFSQIPLFALADQRLAWIDRRQELLASNIANADTPGWRARDLVPFIKTLQRASLVLARTDPAHLGGADGSGSLAAQQEKTERAPDGNGVAIDQELKKVADTDTAHELVNLIDMKYLGLFRTVIGK
jgi:flagellar basal-body rod protein FlgB